MHTRLSFHRAHCVHKKVVGCRGGSRYVEGCWGFPYLKIEMCFICIFAEVDVVMEDVAAVAATRVLPTRMLDLTTLR